MKRIYSAGAVFLAALASSSAGRANGRFPRALHLIEDSCDPNHLVLTATYGMLSTFDRGLHWYHACDAAFSLQGMYSGDPLVALLRDGAMLVDVQSGIHASPSHACGFRKSLAPPGEAIADFTRVTQQGSDLVVALATRPGDGGSVQQLHESRDEGATWQAIGTPLPAPTILTIDVAPSDPNLIYATGLSSAGAGVFLRSRDHGATWQLSPLADTDTDTDARPYIAAVHPTDSAKIFVRTDAWTNRAIIDTAADALFYSADGGTTWRRVIEPREAKLLGFALSPDGKTVLAGFGNTNDSTVEIDPAATGLFAAPLETLAFTQVKDGSVNCLTWTPRGLFVCTPQDETGFQLGMAQGPESALAPLLRLSDVAGPLPGCEPACDWSAACVPFAACGNRVDRDASLPAPRMCGASDGDAGTLTPGAGGEPSGADGSAVPGEASAVASSSCSCRTAGSPRASAWVIRAWGAIVLAGWWSRRARRRRLA